MKQSLIVLFVLCGFVAAMVPRDRRAVNTEDEELFKSQSTTMASDTANQPMICAKQTPCGWSIYRPISKYIEMNITNTYCICSATENCVVTDDDSTINAYIHHCRPADHEDTEQS